MFSKAYNDVSGFTRPVMTAVRRRDGKTESSIGTFIVLNADGWILTAAHIVTGIQKILTSAVVVKEHEAKAAVIKNDTSIDEKERKRRLRALGHPPEDASSSCAVRWGMGNMPTHMVETYALPEVDLAIGRLHPFDSSGIVSYPKIKDPGKAFFRGTSLCRFGYPFASMNVQVNPAANTFHFDGVPPVFPNEGIYTRQVDVEMPDGSKPQSPFPLLFIETSSPGLKGQSGGPIVDVHGAVWGIQSITRSYPLGFDAKVKDGDKVRDASNDFFHVGWGIHAATIVGFLNQRGVKYELSDH